jgi:predicted nucleic acid-binding protein
MPPPDLLDTTILLHWTRNSRQAQAIEEQFGLAELEMRPLICVVSIGEMLAFSRSNNWGLNKLQRLEDILANHVVTVDISDPRVLDAYADLSTLAQSRGWSLFHGKNDLWVGAASIATASHLLTMDTDFLPARGQVAGLEATVLDATTARLVP